MARGTRVLGAIVLVVSLAVVAIVAGMVVDRGAPSAPDAPTPSATADPTPRTQPAPATPAATPSAAPPTGPDTTTASAWCLPQRGNVGASRVILAATGSSGATEVVATPLRAGVGSTASTTVEADSTSVLAIDPPTSAVAVGWDGPDLVASQVSTFPRGPAGTIAGPCATRLVTDTVFPGLTTTDGTSATITIGNPTDEETAVAVELLTASGREEPGYSQFVPITAGATTVFFVNDIAPDVDVLAVRIHSLHGRFAVSAMQARVPRGSDVSGRTWVVAPDEAATTWHLPWVATADDASAGLERPAGTGEPTASWLSVANPGDRPATVAVDLLTATGARPLGLGADATVGPGSVRRLALLDALTGLAGDVGVHVTSDLPVVVGAGAVVRTVSGRSGITASTGHAAPGTRWVLSGPADPERHQVLALANPGDTLALVEVSVRTEGGPLAAPDLVDLAVEPGTTRRVDLPATGDASTITAVATATEGSIVAGLRSGLRAPDELDLVTVHAMAAGG